VAMEENTGTLQPDCNSLYKGIVYILSRAGKSRF